jgi:hypothetical protein
MVERIAFSGCSNSTGTCSGSARGIACIRSAFACGRAHRNRHRRLTTRTQVLQQDAQHLGQGAPGRPEQSRVGMLLEDCRRAHGTRCWHGRSRAATRGPQGSLGTTSMLGHRVQSPSSIDSFRTSCPRSWRSISANSSWLALRRDLSAAQQVQTASASGVERTAQVPCAKTVRCHGNQGSVTRAWSATDLSCAADRLNRRGSSRRLDQVVVEAPLPACAGDPPAAPAVDARPAASPCAPSAREAAQRPARRRMPAAAARHADVEEHHARRECAAKRRSKLRRCRTGRAHSVIQAQQLRRIIAIVSAAIALSSTPT